MRQGSLIRKVITTITHLTIAAKRPKTEMVMKAEMEVPSSLETVPPDQARRQEKLPAATDDYKANAVTEHVSGRLQFIF